MPGSGPPSDPGGAPGLGAPGAPPDPAGDLGAAPSEDDEDGRIGIFPSWRAVYIAVIVYTAGLIAVLRVLTVLLDTSAG